MENHLKMKRERANEVDLSVIIPAFRAQDFIGRAIRPALASTEIELEVIVIDDLSDDETVEAVEKDFREEPRVRVMQRNSNPTLVAQIGPAKVRQLGPMRATPLLMVER